MTYGAPILGNLQLVFVGTLIMNMTAMRYGKVWGPNRQKMRGTANPLLITNDYVYTLFLIPWLYNLSSFTGMLNHVKIYADHMYTIELHIQIHILRYQHQQITPEIPNLGQGHYIVSHWMISPT